MIESQIQQAIQYNKDRKEIDYDIGDWVVVKRSKLNTLKNFKIEDQLKLLPNYCGPFKIIYKRSKVNYVIKVSNLRKSERTVHVDDIKPFIEEDKTIFANRSKRSHIPLSDEIEEIVDQRQRIYGRGSRIEYRIRYKNASEDHDEWVPLHYLEEVPELLNKFNSNNNNQLNNNSNNN